MCVPEHVCVHNICMSVFVSLRSLSSVVSRIVFYLHVNRTGTRRMSTHHITNPTQKKKKKHFIPSFFFLFIRGLFCVSYPPTVLLPFVLIQQLSVALWFGSQSKMQLNQLRVMQYKSELTLNIIPINSVCQRDPFH